MRGYLSACRFLRGRSTHAPRVRYFVISELVIGQRLESLLASNGGRVELGWFRKAYEAQFEELDCTGKFSKYLERFERMNVEGQHCSLRGKTAGAKETEASVTNDPIGRRLANIVALYGGKMELVHLRKSYETDFGFLAYEGKLSNFYRRFTELRVEGSFCYDRETPQRKPVTLLSQQTQIDKILEQKDWLCDEEVIAIDCEGVPDKLHMLQMATASDIFVFDGTLLGPANIGKCIESVLRCGEVTKVFHDLHNDAAALQTFAHVPASSVSGILDTQLVMEYRTGEVAHGLNSMLRYFGQQENEEKKKVTSQTREEFYSALEERPIKSWAVNYAAEDVSHLRQAWSAIEQLVDADVLKLLKESSCERYQSAACSNGKRRVRFHPGTATMMSSELLTALHKDKETTVPPVVLHSESDSLLDVLPSDLRESVIENVGPKPR